MFQQNLEKRRGKERKQTVVSFLNPKTVDILLSAHALTLKADILQLEQKAGIFFYQFGLSIAR